MPTKDFDRIVRFYEYRDPHGTLLWFPLVDVTLISPNGNRISLSLLFDTGASVTTLRNDLYPLLGLHSWDQGQAKQTATASNVVTAYQYEATFEIGGKTINCPIHLLPLPPNPLYHGLLGRDTVFTEFGFGFWESTHELFITESP
jgi:predicted aspartyl protease